MRIYLDNCCFNRPYDDQSSFRVLLETQAKLYVQEKVRQGLYDLVCSCCLCSLRGMRLFFDHRYKTAKTLQRHRNKNS